MKVTGGAAGETPEGPLEKGMEAVAEKTGEEKRGLSKGLYAVADKVDQTGASVINTTSNWERTAFSGISNSLRAGSDYIQKIKIDEQLDRAASSIRKNPTQALLIALGVGLLLGFIVRRR
ncbi:MAG TPA: hypothetical protein VE439_11155 [Anaerolineae bacterium]|nr:hypothetical protein [Anaerolineae bacterium]